MSVRLKQYLKVTSIKLILTYVLTAVHALMFVPWRQFIRLNRNTILRNQGAKKALFLLRIVPGLLKNLLNIDILHKRFKTCSPVFIHVRFNYPESKPDSCPARRL